jgi:hypothetical protein
MKCYKWSSVIYPVGWTVCQKCWMYPFFNERVCEVHFTSALCTLLQYIAKIRKGIWKSFPVPLGEFIVHTQFPDLVAVRQGVCCYSLSASFKYALFSFLKETDKDQTGKSLANKLLTESGSIRHTEPTNLTLCDPNCLRPTFSSFKLCHSRTQKQSTVLTSSKGSQKEVSLRGGTKSHVAVTKLETQNILYSYGKILPAVSKIKHQTALQS